MLNENNVIKNIDSIAELTIDFAGVIADKGFSVIIDFVFEDNYETWIEYCITRLKDYDVRFIKVFCELDELLRREELRGDRTAGLASYQFSHMNIIEQYDFFIDTTSQSAENCAKQLMAYLASSAKGDALRQLIESQYE